MRISDDEALAAAFAGCDILSPGGPEETRALAAALGLGRGMRVLELGGGTGRAAIQLAHELGVEVVVVERASRLAKAARMRAVREGQGGRVSVVEGDMRDAENLFPPGSFAALLSEGALYHMGIEPAVRAARRLLRPGGGLGFTELSWLVPPDQAPAEVRLFWERDAPGVIEPVAVKVARLERAGVRDVRSFALPEAAWDRYYAPVRENLAALRARGALSPVIDHLETEIRLHYEGGGRAAAGYVAYTGALAGAPP